MSFFDQGRKGGNVDVRAMLDSDAPALIAGLVDLGVLVSIGLTSDRGAAHVQITSGGRWVREYFHDAEDLREWLTDALVALTDEGPAATPVGPPVPPTSPRPRRGSQKAS